VGRWSLATIVQRLPYRGTGVRRSNDLRESRLRGSVLGHQPIAGPSPRLYAFDAHGEYVGPLSRPYTSMPQVRCLSDASGRAGVHDVGGVTPLDLTQVGDSVGLRREQR
jgi:hypothetical protein